MSYNTWPTFAGRGWNIKKRPITRTIIETADGGQEFRLARFQNPLYEFDVEIPYLSQADYATLQNFFAQQGGPFTPFLFYPDNEAATATPFFTGDGVTTQATLLMPDGSPALFANSGATPIVTGLHQTDWQGRLALSNQPRTNYEFPSAGGNFGASSAYVNASPIDAPDGSNNGVRITLNGTNNAAARFECPLTASSAGQTWVWSWSARNSDALSGMPVGLVTPLAVNMTTGPVTQIGPTTDGYARFACVFTAIAAGSVIARLYFGNKNLAAGQFIDYFGHTVENGSVAGAYIANASASAAVTVTDYTQAGSQITFGQVPAVGAVEDWDGTYAYLVRFKDDQIEMTQTMSQIYEATAVTLRSVR